MQLSVTLQDQQATQHALILQRVLGRGKFTVYHAKGTASTIDLALKVFPKSSSSNIHYQREKRFLNKLQNHNNIINYIPISEHTLPYDLLATEFTPHGDFFDFVTVIGINNKKLARTYFQQLINGVEYLHSQGVAHCDLKLENLLLDKSYTLKIFDFDQAQDLEDKEMTSGGTCNYRAPELLNKTLKKSSPLDVYSAGVILYTFLTGLMPFNESKACAVSKGARYETFVTSNTRFWREKVKETGANFDEELRELLNGMWAPNTEQRLTIEQVKRSKWFNKEVYSGEELVQIMTEKMAKK